MSTRNARMDRTGLEWTGPVGRRTGGEGYKRLRVPYNPKCALLSLEPLEQKYQMRKATRMKKVCRKMKIEFFYEEVSIGSPNASSKVLRTVRMYNWTKFTY